MPPVEDYDPAQGWDVGDFLVDIDSAGGMYTWRVSDVVYAPPDEGDDPYPLYVAMGAGLFLLLEDYAEAESDDEDDDDGVLVNCNECAGAA